MQFCVLASGLAVMPALTIAIPVTSKIACLSRLVTLVVQQVAGGTTGIVGRLLGHAIDEAKKASVVLGNAAQIANARMIDTVGLWANLRLEAHKRWCNVSSPAGTIPALLLDRQSALYDRMDPIPSVGEYTEAILRSLGRSAPDIAALRATEAF